MRLRVLHVLDHSWPVLDGYAQRSRSIVASQAKIGMLPTVLTSSLHQLDDPSSSDLTLDEIPYLRTGIPSGLYGRAILNRWPFLREVAVVRLLEKRIRAVLESAEFDLVHAHSPALCGLAAWRAAKSRRIPFVYEVRSFWEDADLNPRSSLPKRFRYHLARALESFVVRRSDATVGIARSVLSDLQARGISPAKLHHVPNGVDVTRFIPRNRDAALAAELGLNDLPILGFIGTLFPWEGVPWLVRAAAQLHDIGTSFRLLIIGDGVDGPQVRSLIQETGSADYISFLGRVPNAQIERYYSLMDLLVYPRLNVRIAQMVTPLKPLEAMALGKAVLGSNVGGIRELVEPGDTGLLFDAESIPDFCKVAARVLSEPRLKSALGENARRAVSQEKNWTALAARYEAVYSSAMRAAAR